MVGPLAVEQVAELGRDLDPVTGDAGLGEAGADELLVEPLAVGVARVEERDPQVERPGDQVIGVLVIAPPVRAERPGPEADGRGLEVGRAEAAGLHAGDSTGGTPPVGMRRGGGESTDRECGKTPPRVVYSYEHIFVD